jgi:hypothetical protein
MFTDANRQDWTLELTIGSIKRVQSLTGVNLLDASDGKVLADLADNPVTIADVLFALVQPQASGRGVSDESFGAALNGDAMRVALEAFIEELIYFFLRFRPEAGKVLQTLWNKINRLSGEMHTMALRKLDSEALDLSTQAALHRLEREIDTKIAESLGTLSMS